MNSCKKICISEGCEENPTYYVNFSRYHAVCRFHLANISYNDIEIKCPNCQNSITCIRDLPLREKSEYKSSLKQTKESSMPSSDSQTSSTSSSRPVSQSATMRAKVPSNPSARSTSQTPSNKCSERNCNIKNTVQNCEVHFFCKNHQPSNDLGKFCKLCRCKYCPAFGVFLKGCGEKVCKMCEVKTRCCKVCCKMTSSSPLNGCQHYLCDSHRDPFLMCPCMPCGNCKVNRAKVRNCGHLLCEQCEVNFACSYCAVSSCDYCQENRAVYMFSCNFHKFCESCYHISQYCIKCYPYCVRCKQNQVTLDPNSTSCKQHPLCFECSKNFNLSFCVYCHNLNDFTCANCNQTNYYFASNLNCCHKICNNCSNLECSHKECPICLSSRKICVNCNPKHFCKRCKTFNSSIPISCSHGLCKNCGILTKDEHYICKTCGKSESLSEGICFFCNPSDEFCSLCSFKFKPKLTSLNKSCNHKLCEICSKIKKNIDDSCIICTPCQLCKDPKCIEKKLTCTHKVCSLFSQDPCIKCSKGLECIFCSRNTNSFSTLYCGECPDSKSLTDFSYNQCFSCLKMIWGLQYNKCGHFHCAKCIKFKRCQRKCRFCGDPFNSLLLSCPHGYCFNCQNNECSACKCVNCGKCISKSTKCKHGLCSRCYRTNCDGCKVSEGCKKCERVSCKSFKKKNENCSFFEDFKEKFGIGKESCGKCRSDDVLCRHMLCFTCRKQDCKCFCYLCNRIRSFDLTVCGHQVCISDSFSINCKKCPKEKCLKCGETGNLKIKDNQYGLVCSYHLDSS